MREIRTRLRLAWAALRGHTIVAHMDVNARSVTFKRSTIVMHDATMTFDTPIHFDDGTHISGI